MQDGAVHDTGRTEVNSAEVGFLVTVRCGGPKQGCCTHGTCSCVGVGVEASVCSVEV